MAILFIRNLVFTILQPCLVAVLIPYWILGARVNGIFSQQFSHSGFHYSGIAIAMTGLTLTTYCIINFAIWGRGTLSPIDPTKRLVVYGPYKFSRNPMYVGVTLILLGEAIFFQSSELWIYSLFVFAAFNIFILLIEEPRLHRDFGEQYIRYCKRVGRWI